MSRSAMEESFFLTKNNYEDSTKTIFKTLLKDDEFTDVTLALSDEKQVKGHKAILGASSSFFRKIFQQNAAANLVLYLKGVKSKDMNSIMEFMYLGQTSVNKADLTTFLESAEDLKIEGLIQPGKASMSVSNAYQAFQSLPEITIDEEKSVSADEFSSANYTNSSLSNPTFDNSSMNQSTFDTSSMSSLSSSMLDTSVSSHDVSNTSEMTFQVTPEFSSTLLPLPVSKEDQEQAALIVANIKKEQSSKLVQNTSILNGSITFNAENKNYSCSKCVFTSVHRRSALRHFANTHADSDQPNIKQEKVIEETGEPSFSSLESSMETTIKSEESGPEKKHECGQCDFTTKHRTSLKRHLYGVHGHEELKPNARENTSTGPKKHSCTSCSFATDHFYSLRRHAETLHGVILGSSASSASPAIQVQDTI